VSAVYPDTKAAFEYIFALESPDSTLDSMGKIPYKLEQLDAKLTKAINVMMTGKVTDLAARLFNLKESHIKGYGQSVKGRQLMWVIYQFYKVDPAAGILFAVEDILDVQMKGSNLEGFLADWDKCLIHMDKPPSEELRTALFVKQVKACPKLKTEWDNYYKAEVGSATRSFEYLYKSATQVVERERFENARKGVTGKGGDSMPAPGDAPKGKGKGKGKGSSTDGSSDAVPPWYWNEGKDTRNETPCAFLAAGHCRLGNNCPWKHGKPGKKHAVPATPAETGVSKSGGGRICYSFELTGKCNFGDACQYSHDLADKKKKSDRKGSGSQDHKSGEKEKGPNHRPSDRKGSDKVEKVKESAGKKDAKKKKKGRPGAVAEVASSGSASGSDSASDLSSSEASYSD
jgi:hypothetical protein